MGLLDRLFKPNSENQAFPSIKFGRYTDSYKKPANYEAWDRSLEKFEEEAYLESFRQFFLYLRDEDEDNVRFWEEEGGIRFEIFQGSKKIIGFADGKKLKAEAKIAHSETLNVGFMRRLIEKNFGLQYSRFALDNDNNIAIVFDTYTLDGSPYKLYYALKELATNADKQDDLLLDEFKILEQVDNQHIESIPDPEKEIKYQFIRTEIDKVMTEINSGKLSKEQYPGGFGYLLLNLIYKLDYLTKPEGFMMETLERMHRMYFAQEAKSPLEKNQNLIKELVKLLDRPKEEFFKEMYKVKSTFGITTPVNHDRILTFVDAELNNMDWYADNGYDAIALSVPGYIIGYSLFNYAIPKPDRDLFHLFYQITQTQFFQQLGFHYDYYDATTGQLNKRSIKKAIEEIVDHNKAKFTKLNPAYASLNYRTLPEFAKSYLLMVRNLDLTKVD
jgi:hypothetical protein